MDRIYRNFLLAAAFTFICGATFSGTAAHAAEASIGGIVAYKIDDTGARVDVNLTGFRLVNPNDVPVTVRVSIKFQSKITELSASTGAPLGDLIDQAPDPAYAPIELVTIAPGQHWSISADQIVPFEDATGADCVADGNVDPALSCGNFTAELSWRDQAVLADGSVRTLTPLKIAQFVQQGEVDLTTGAVLSITTRSLTID